MEIISHPNAKELRQEEIKKLWSGFQQYRAINSWLEPIRRYQIETAYFNTNGREMFPKRMDASLELLDMFFYGAHLVQELKPELTKNIAIPPLVINELSDEISHVVTRSCDNKTVLSYIEIGLENILYPDKFFSPHIEPWRFETDTTVSQHWKDVVLVDTFMSGVEEYSHEIFQRFKNKEKVKEKIFNDKDLQQLSKTMFLEKRYEEGLLLYHLQNIERKALVWQHKILQKYLPHWTYPTKFFEEQVSRLRQNSVDMESRAKQRK